MEPAAPRERRRRALMLFEHRREPLLSRAAFLRRVLRHGAASGALVSGSLVVGTVGYHALARLSWIDSFLNASMLLGGMGPVGDIPTDAGKIFASFYALYAGLVFLVAGGIVLAPSMHRILHRLHLEEVEEEKPPDVGEPPR